MIGPYQVLGFTLEWPETGGAIKDAFTTIRIDENELEATMLGSARAGGIEPEEIPPEQAIEAIARGAQACAEVGFGPGEEALLAVTLLLRASVRPDADDLIASLATLPSVSFVLDEPDGEDSEDGELEDGEHEEPDEAALRDEIDALLDALDAWCAGRALDGERRELTLYAGGTMADFRVWYADGQIAAWSPPELVEYLLEWVPRKVDLEDSHIAPFPLAVAEVLRFLGETDRLDPQVAETLARMAAGLAEEFVDRALDPQNFGLAKAMTQAMLDDGVDLSDPAELDVWIAGFNALTVADREERVPALGLLPGSRRDTTAGPRRGRAAKARKAKRQARKRNRRR